MREKIVKLLAIYENNGYEIFDLKESEAKKQAYNLKLRTILTVGMEKFYFITDEVLEHCKTKDEIFGLFKTLSDKRREIFFIEL